jgi:ATP-binding cassette subfamily B protein
VNAISRILEHCGPNRTTLAAGAACSVAESVLELAPYGILYLAILECSRPAPDEAALARLALAALAAILARGCLRWAAGILAHRAGYRTLCAVQQKLAEHLPKLPMLSLSSTTSGAVLKVLDKDVERLETLLCHHIPDLCAAAATPVLSLCVLLWLDWRLALAALVPLLLAASCQARMFRECSARMAPFHESMAAMNGVVAEYLGGIMEIKAFNQNVRSFARFSESVGGYEARPRPGPERRADITPCSAACAEPGGCFCCRRACGCLAVERSALPTFCSG